MTIFKYSMMAAGSLLLGGFAGLTPMTAANAADLGGNCCSDLEQRVAELEATAARKGNTKVSLTVYGQVNRALLAWDDGKDSDAYIVDNSISSTRFGFKGDAKLKPGWKAGFNIEIETRDTASNLVAQDNYNTGTAVDSVSGAGVLRIRQANWYIEGERTGRLTVGQQNSATKDGVLINLSGSAADPQNYYATSFKIRTSTGDSFSTWGTFFSALDTDRYHMVRYDSPSVYGFILSAAWGENDFWDAALRFAREFGSIKVAAYAGYAWNARGDNNLTHVHVNSLEHWTGGISAMHMPTGLYVNVIGGDEDSEARTKHASYVYVQGGIHRKFLPLGATTVYGDFGQYNDFGASSTAITSTNELVFTITGSEVDRWGVGVTQAFDSAAMELYAQYHHYKLDLDVTMTTGDRPSLEAWDAVVAGAKIKF